MWTNPSAATPFDWSGDALLLDFVCSLAIGVARLEGSKFGVSTSRRAKRCLRPSRRARPCRAMSAVGAPLPHAPPPNWVWGRGFIEDSLRVQGQGLELSGDKYSGLNVIHRDTSLIRNTLTVGPYSSRLPEARW